MKTINWGLTNIKSKYGFFVLQFCDNGKTVNSYRRLPGLFCKLSGMPNSAVAIFRPKGYKSYIENIDKHRTIYKLKKLK